VFLLGAFYLGNPEMNELLAIFIFFFAVIDPIGTVPVFIAVTRGEDDKFKRKVIFKAVGVSAVVLLFFVVAGELLLNAIEIPLSAFQIAGGIVLLLFALSMILGDAVYRLSSHLRIHLYLHTLPTTKLKKYELQLSNFSFQFSGLESFG
jgi:multiple antibiotic resistance protein